MDDCSGLLNRRCVSFRRFESCTFRHMSSVRMTCGIGLCARASSVEGPERKNMNESRGKFAAAFYGSGAWQKCREDYAKSKTWICERCGETGSQVHHKVRLTVSNLNDPAVALNWANLELLCDDCHKAEHKKRKKKKTKRYSVAKDGTLLIT